MKQAVHFGAGNIGRGFIGLLLHKANYHVTFVDVQESLLNSINAKGGYDVEIVGEDKKTIHVNNISAIHSAASQLVETLSHADIITTAVGPVVLNKIAPSIAAAIELAINNKRNKPLNIIACENALRASSSLKGDVIKHLAASGHSSLPNWVSFVDAAVDRIVPPAGEEAKRDNLFVRVEEFCEWLVDKHQFNHEAPIIDGMTIVDNLDAGVERKLFTLNTGHAICAWMGQYLGHTTIGEAIKDERVLAIVKSAMIQSGDALITKHGFDASAHHTYINKILTRFSNPYIIDDVERVGRQPIRKLSPNERIISPILCALDYQLNIDKLLLGAAAAMKFSSNDDPQVTELQAQIKQHGIEQTFVKISGLKHLSSEFMNQMANLESMR